MIEIHILKLIVSYFLFFMIGILSYKVYILVNEYKALKRKIKDNKELQEKMNIEKELEKIIEQNKP